jgi:hypothetical protein
MTTDPANEMRAMSSNFNPAKDINVSNSFISASEASMASSLVVISQ